MSTDLVLYFGFLEPYPIDLDNARLVARLVAVLLNDGLFEREPRRYGNLTVLAVEAVH